MRRRHRLGSGAAARRRSARALVRALAVAALAGTLLSVAGPALAHPLGNFTANTSAHLLVGGSATRIEYVLDLAEIPAFQARQTIDADADGEVSGAEGERYTASECAAIAAGLSLAVDGGDTAALQVEAAALDFPDGEAGLQTLRLTCSLRAETGPLPSGARVSYRDDTRRDRAGWREVSAAGDGARLLDSDVPADSPSDQLRDYPRDRLAAPLAQTTAALRVEPSGGGSSPAAVGGPREGPGGLVAGLDGALGGLLARRRLTPGLGALALGIAFVLGMLHAVAPGHGKTVMAAYLVGRRGSVRDAVQLGVTVAVTHTVGVLLLGAALSASEAIAPERLYPLLGLASGLLFAGVGLTLLRSALSQRRAPGSHGHDHGGHDHGGHGHARHGHDHGGGRAAGDAGWRGLIAPGLAGGLVPSPSALLVLLAGTTLGRSGFAVAGVLAYGLGMSTTLVGAGWVLLRARSRLNGRALPARWARWRPLAEAAPLATACLVVLGGLVLAARSVLAA